MAARFDTSLPATGALQLPQCDQCERVNYPPRELCGGCLGDSLSWRPVPAGGTVQSLTALHYSLEPCYGEHLPWRVGSVRLDCGPIAFAHLQPDLGIEARVTLRIASDRAGNRMLVALAESGPKEAAQAWLARINFTEETT